MGAGQQQVRFFWANIGPFHVCLWTFTMTEAWAWWRSEEELVDRQASPWDDPNRRPSHADKRLAWRRELLAEEIRAVLRPGVTDVEIQAAAERPTQPGRMTVKRIAESTVPLLFALFRSALSAVEIFRINRGPAADMGCRLLRRPCARRCRRRSRRR